MEQVAADGKTRKMNLYNLDVIISVGYRVNSKQATQFRVWATKVLKEHLVKGYTINEKRLLQYQNSFQNLQETIALLQEKSKHELLAGQEGEIYLCFQTIKKELIIKKEASYLFGQENSEKFKVILGNIYQTFGKKELYSWLEEKAAHLFYFIIKDHPFVDGNKRIASFLFIYLLDKNNYLYKPNGEKKINDNALTALSILIAITNSDEKEKFIRLITNLLTI